MLALATYMGHVDINATYWYLEATPELLCGHVTVCAGLRVPELTGLQLDDVTVPSMSIRDHGKGRRERAMPLWKAAATALRAWLAIRGTATVPEVFPAVSIPGFQGVKYLLLHFRSTFQSL